MTARFYLQSRFVENHYGFCPFLVLYACLINKPVGVFQKRRDCELNFIQRVRCLGIRRTKIQRYRIVFLVRIFKFTKVFRRVINRRLEYALKYRETRKYDVETQKQITKYMQQYAPT